MQFQASETEITQAQLPHNLLIAGLFAFNLLMAPAVLALKIGMVGLLIPLFSSSALVAYLYWRSKKTTRWFVDMHWKLAFSHSQWLMIGYA
ncbi:MAG TPA: hypothetical protein DHV67_03860, partial [Gallionella sp.]|nr:hypothetical protein [Gallionella sp.]